MPHLEYFNRYWRLSGDEFSVPAICSIIGRVTWVVLISIIAAVTYDSLASCKYGIILICYLLNTILLFGLSIVCDCFIVAVSLQGSITETKKRANLPDYLTIRLIVGFLQFLMAVFGILSLAHTRIPCNKDFQSDNLNNLFIYIVVISQLVDVFLLMCCAYLFSAKSVDHLSREKTETSELEKWTDKCKNTVGLAQTLTCGILGGGNITEGFEEVAKVLTNLFHHDGFLDVVPSDVVAGIILVRLDQRNRRKEYFERKATSKKSFHANPALGGGTTINISISDDYVSSTLEPSPIAPTRRTSKPAPSFDLNDDNHMPVAEPATKFPNELQQIMSLDLNDGDDEVVVTDLALVDLMTRCSIYALAVCAHLMLTFINPVSGLPRALCTTLCTRDGLHAGSNKGESTGPVHACSCCCVAGGKSRMLRGEDIVVEDDNSCGLNYAGMKVFMKALPDTEVLFCSFFTDTTHKPHAIFLDHEKKLVVITARGTLSLEDCITDALCEPISLEECGRMWGFDGHNRWAHEGMLKVAQNIREEIEESGVLRKIFNEESDYCTYELVVTGHSLGAGIGTMLALMLRSAYPKLKCITFGTPGSLFDRRSAEEYKSFMVSCVLSNDMVARSNFHSICNLRNKVLDAICRAKVNKMYIMQAIFKDFDTDDLMYASGEEPDSDLKRQIQQYKTEIKARIDKQAQEQLCIPGRIIRFIKTSNVKMCGMNYPGYTLQEAAISDFNDIQVSTTMVSDHMPHRYVAELTKIAARMRQMRR